MPFLGFLFLLFALPESKKIALLNRSSLLHQQFQGKKTLLMVGLDLEGTPTWEKDAVVFLSTQEVQTSTF